MKYQESFVGSKAEFADYIKKAIPDLFAGKLVVEGKQVALPSDTEFDYKVKYDEDESGGSVTFKVSWENAEDIELDLQEE
ncbi:MAG: transcription initiation factor IIE [Bacillota bacterium]